MPPRKPSNAERASSNCWVERLRSRVDSRSMKANIRIAASAAPMMSQSCFPKPLNWLDALSAAANADADGRFSAWGHPQPQSTRHHCARAAPIEASARRARRRGRAWRRSPQPCSRRDAWPHSGTIPRELHRRGWATMFLCSFRWSSRRKANPLFPLGGKNIASEFRGWVTHHQNPNDLSSRRQPGRHHAIRP